MGNHEFCIECGISDHHRGRECDPETKRKYGNRKNPCSCSVMVLVGSRTCQTCGGRQIIKKSDVTDIMTRIEWEWVVTEKKVAKLKEKIKLAMEERDENIGKIRSKCKHEWSGFGEAYSCELCGLAEFD